MSGGACRPDEFGPQAECLASSLRAGFNRREENRVEVSARLSVSVCNE